MTCPVPPPDLAALDIPALAACFPALLADIIQPLPCATAPHLFSTSAGITNRGRDTVHAAQRLCAQCHLRDPCAAYATQHHERGIWGGTTQYQRARVCKENGSVP